MLYSDARIVNRLFVISRGFISGVGICYGPSQIVNAQYQYVAARLRIGERLAPHTFVRAADGRPFDIQDLCPADTRFRILVFGGDLTIEADRTRLQAAGAEMDKPGSFLKRFGRGGARGGDWRVFEVLCFSSAKADVVDHVGTYIHPVQRWRKSSYSPIRLPCLLPPSLVQVSAMRPCTCDSWLIGYITESSSMTRTHSVNRGEEGIRDTASIRTPVLSS